MSFLLLHVTQNMMFRSHRFRVKLRELMALGVSFHQSRIWNSDQFITWFRGGTERYQDTHIFFSRVGAELRKFALQTSVSLATMPGSIPESMYIVFFPWATPVFPFLSFYWPWIIQNCCLPLEGEQGLKVGFTTVWNYHEVIFVIILGDGNTRICIWSAVWNEWIWSSHSIVKQCHDHIHLILFSSQFNSSQQSAVFSPRCKIV